MPIQRDDDLLFGVTALQLRFVSQEDIAAVTAQRPGASLRETLVARGLITAGEAEAVAAVVRQRLARFDHDPRRAIDSVAGAEAASLSGNPDGSAATLAGRSDPRAEASPADNFATAPQAATRSSAGQRYVILRPWQQGGLGRVSVALDRELNREIALKEIIPQHADHEENRLRFIREAEVTGALEHPGIVPVYSLGEFSDGRPYYAMRFVRGVNLQTAIADHFTETSPDELYRGVRFRLLLGKFIDVCHAVGYAHSRGVLHRDIKPANIMLGDYGESLVVDWGLARFLDHSQDSLPLLTPPVHPSDRASGSYTQAGRIVGTPAYMSPEQAEGRLDLLSPASDIYGLGATLYHLLVGEPPFDVTSDDAPLLAQQSRFVRPRSRRKAIPAPLEAICLRAMARRPQERYASAEELALDVERYLADDAVAAHREPWRSWLWRWIRNHRVWVMSGMTASVVALAALSIGLGLVSAAHRRESAALRQSEDNLAEARTQRARAEQNFARAQEAVQNYYMLVSEETLLDQPGMQPLRNALLRQALTYYEEFLSERQDDPRVARETARAAYAAGRIAEIIGQPGDAIEHLERAIALAESLGAASLDRRGAESDLAEDPRVLEAQSLNALGGVLQRQQQYDEARERYERAAELRKALAAETPDDMERAREFANSLMNLGQLTAFEGRPEEALPLLLQAQSVRLAHEGADPPVALLRDLGKGRYNVAVAQLQTGDVVAARNNLEAAVSDFQQIADADPHDLDNVRRLGAARRLLADLLAQQGKLDEAVGLYRAALQPLTELAARNPDVTEYAADAAGIEMNLGETLAALGENDAALGEVERAIARLETLVGRAEATDRQRRDLATALRFAGRVLMEARRPEEALDRLQAARDLLGALVRKRPDDPQLSADMQETLQLLGEANRL